MFVLFVFCWIVARKREREGGRKEMLLIQFGLVTRAFLAWLWKLHYLHVSVCVSSLLACIFESCFVMVL